jgi:hypothetical protein
MALGMPSAALQAACLALRSREFNARRFGVHQVGVLVRQLVQNMQVLRANRLAKGRSHRPSTLTCLLFAAPSALFGSHAAVEVFDCRTVVAPRSLTARRPVQKATARLDLRLLRPTVARALARSFTRKQSGQSPSTQRRRSRARQSISA